MKFTSVQCFRGIAANAVLLAHLTSIEAKYSQGVSVLPDWTRSLGPTGVNFFFVISGFVIAYIARDSTPVRFAVSRVLRIFPAYWFYTSIVVAAFLIAPTAVNSSFAHPPSILKSYLLWPQDVGPMLAVGWTLIHEMYFYIVFALILTLRIPIIPALLIWSIAVAIMLSVGSHDTPVLSVVFSPLTYLFIAGAVVGTAIRQGYARFAIASLVAGCICLAAGVFWYAQSGFEPTGYESVLLLGVPFIPIIYGATAFELTNRVRLPLPLQAAGEASYSTYLSHVLVVSALGHAFVRLPLHNPATEVTFLILCVMAANAVGLASYRFLERPILNLQRARPALRGLGVKEAASPTTGTW